MKKLSFREEDDFKKVLRGLNRAADAVTMTLGPNGQNVYFESPLGYEITNDGVTVASQITLKDKFEDAGAYIIRNITAQSNDDSGDGTTTTALLTQKIIAECLKRPENPMEIRESLKKATEQVLKRLAKSAVKLKKGDIEKVAYISSENKEIAKLITEIIEKLGEKAVIHVEDSKTFETYYEIVDGYEAQAGFMSPQFINEKKTGRAVYQNVPVLVTEKKISNLVDIAPIFDEFKKEGIGECVIVCDDIDDSMLGVFVNSKNMGTFKSVVIRATAETLTDIAGVTGASIVSDRTGLTFKELKTEHLGKANKVVSELNKTLFLVEAQTAKQHADMIEYQNAGETNMYIRERIDIRLARLRGGVATLRIAAPTDTERTYLRRKAEDAVKATQAALVEGVVKGGGMAFYELAQELKGRTIGENILKVALTAPLRKILENSGKDYTDVVLRLNGKGYDAKNSIYTDFFQAGILDPAKVSRVALENASSTAGIFITTNVVIIDQDEDKS